MIFTHQEAGWLTALIDSLGKGQRIRISREVDVAHERMVYWVQPSSRRVQPSSRIADTLWLRLTRTSKEKARGVWRA